MRTPYFPSPPPKLAISSNDSARQHHHDVGLVRETPKQVMSNADEMLDAPSPVLSTSSGGGVFHQQHGVGFKEEAPEQEKLVAAGQGPEKDKSVAGVLAMKPKEAAGVPVSSPSSRSRSK